MLKCEGQKGLVRLFFTGLPAQTRVLISDHVEDPTQTTATWHFVGRKMIELNPANFPSKGHQVVDSFDTLFIKILCDTDCVFSVDVFFPEEDERRQREKVGRATVLSDPNDLKLIWNREKRVNVKEAKLLLQQQIDAIVRDTDFSSAFIKDCEKLKRVRS